MGGPRRVFRRRLVALSLVAAVAAPLASQISHADYVINDIVTSDESVTIQQGSSAAVGFNLENQNNVAGDPDNACNVRGPRAVEISFVDLPSGIAIGGFTIDECGSLAVTTTVTVGSGTPAGSYPITAAMFQATQIGDSDGIYNFGQAAFTVVVTASNTAPTVTVAGVADGASYVKGAVPAATCQVTDAEEGNSSFPATLEAVVGPYAADGIGSQTAKCSYTDAGGLTATAEATYTIVDPTPPTITPNVSGTLGDNGWYVSDVTVSWTVSDPGSSFTSTGCDPTVISTDTPGTTVTCSATSAGGTSNQSVTIKRDATKPTIIGSRAPAANDKGWNNTDVVVSFLCSDATSGLAGACPVDVTVSTEGFDQSVTRQVADQAGNVASAKVDAINIDKTAPTISGSPSPAPNANGWNNTDVTVSFDCNDALSGVDTCDDPVVLTGEGAGQNASGTATDNAGNSNSTTVSGINIDKTAPTVELVGGPAAGGTYYFGFVPPEPTCSASDALSGLDGDCEVSGYSSGIGSHTVTATASDKAGNSATPDSHAYTVAAWTLKGFYQPVDMNGVWNTVKGGSTVPLKFEIFAGPNELTTVDAIKSFTVIVANCAGGEDEDTIELTTTGGTSLRYDSTGGQFIQNWQTPKKPGTCYRVTMTAADGSSIVAFFKLK